MVQIKNQHYLKIKLSNSREKTLLPKKYIKKGEVIKGDMLVIKRLRIGNRAIYFKKIIDTIVNVNI